MKSSRTTLLLICCIAVSCYSQAQFQKGDWLLEGGGDLRWEKAHGKADVDLSQGTFRVSVSNGFSWNVSAGKFIGDHREIGISFEEDWRRITHESHYLSGSNIVVWIGEITNYSFVTNLFFRRYYHWNRRWFGGYRVAVSSVYGYYTSQVIVNGTKSPLIGNINYKIGANANMFVARMLGKRFGARVSVGNIGWSVRSEQRAKRLRYSSFDLNLRNVVFPNISLFWTFHGKSKNDRD
ncbi:MAG: hypothetical protein KF734_16450 [Saprospiraceae bacterium]|nr:hypothetical protein [Saprospiraceae bacterium]